MSGLYIERKRELHIGRWLLLIIFSALLVSTAWFGYRWFTMGEKPPLVPLPASALADPSVDEKPVSQEEIENHTVPSNHPRYISIPALGIMKARVQSVGLTPTRAIDTPKNISDTGWFKESAFPGQNFGTVIIDGHNGGVTRDGVFAGLDKLKEGDEIIIERGDGKKFTYLVAENRTESLVEVNKNGMKRLMTPFDPDKEGLGLITCAGNWIPRDKVFDKRILVRAVIK